MEIQWGLISLVGDITGPREDLCVVVIIVSRSRKLSIFVFILPQRLCGKNYIHTYITYIYIYIYIYELEPHMLTVKRRRNKFLCIFVILRPEIYHA